MEAFENTGIYQLKVALKKMGVTCMYHITSEKNLKSIQEKGLMPSSALDTADFEYSPGSDRIDRILSKRKGLDSYTALSLTPSPDFLDIAIRSGLLDGNSVIIEIALEVLDRYDFTYYNGNPLIEGSEPIPTEDIINNLSTSGLFLIQAAIPKAFFIAATRLEISRIDGKVTTKRHRRLLGKNGVKVSSYYFVLLLAVIATFGCAVLYHYFRKADLLSRQYAILLVENERLKDAYEDNIIRQFSLRKIYNIFKTDEPYPTVEVMSLINRFAGAVCEQKTSNFFWKHKNTLNWNIFDDFDNLTQDTTKVFSSPYFFKSYSANLVFKDNDISVDDDYGPLPARIILRGLEDHPKLLEIVQEYKGKKSYSNYEMLFSVFDLIKIRQNLTSIDGIEYGTLYKDSNDLYYAYWDNSLGGKRNVHVLIAASMEDLYSFSNNILQGRVITSSDGVISPIVFNEDEMFEVEQYDYLADTISTHLPNRAKIQTNYHIWEVLEFIECGSKIHIKKRVTPLIEASWIMVSFTDFIENADNGDRYYLMDSSLGFDNVYLLNGYGPVEFIETYPPLPDNIKCINIHFDDGEYYIKNFKIRD